MQLFNSVVRQYTPPTCWLEIEAKESPLSRWVRLPMLNQLRFELRFNDPREPEEKQVTIWGNGAELEALHEAVTTYVQQFIEQSPNQLLVAVREPSNNGSRLPMMPDEDNNYHSTAITAPNFNSFSSGAGYEQDPETVPQQYRPEEEAPRPSMMLSATPYLRPKSLVAHELFFGPLQTEESGPVILLTASQLFDLATALDEYATDVVTMPNLKAARPSPVRTEYIGAAVAMGGLLVVGLGIIIFNLNHHSAPATVTAAATPSMPEPTPIDPYASPLPTSPAVSTIPSPLAFPSSSATALPTQPGQVPITSTQPGQLPLVQPLPQQPDQISTQTGQPYQIGTQSGQPYQIGTQSGQPYQIGTQSGQVAPSRNTKTAGGSSQRQTSSAATRDSNRNSQSPSVASSSKQPLRLLKPSNGITIPSLGNVPPVTSSSRDPNLHVGQSIGDLNYHVNPAPVSPPIALGSSPDNQATPSEVLPSTSAASLGIGNSPTIERPPDLTANANANSDNTLFDRIPQVAEARLYLEKRWQPPQDLKGSLDYTLIVAGDGTIERIIPLTQAAKNYIDKSGIPKIGEKFVSPPGRIANIRVDLKSDGKVETMLIP